MTLGALGARPSSRVACRGRGRERGAAEAGGASRARVHLRLRRTPVCTHPQRQSVRRCTTRAPPPHQLESRDRLARALALGLHLAPRPSPPPSSCQKEKLGSEPRLLRLRLSALLRRKLLCLIFDLARLLGRLLASWRPWPHAKAASSTCRLIDRRSRKASEEAGPWTPWPMAPCDGWLLFLKVDTPLLGARGHPGTGVDTAVCAAQRRPKNLCVYRVQHVSATVHTHTLYASHFSLVIPSFDVAPASPHGADHPHSSFNERPLTQRTAPPPRTPAHRTPRSRPHPRTSSRFTRRRRPAARWSRAA